MKDYYKILRISKDADQKTIKAAYRRMARMYHPDVYRGTEEYANEKMQEINEAYQFFVDNDFKVDNSVIFERKQENKTNQKKNKWPSQKTKTNEEFEKKIDNYFIFLKFFIWFNSNYSLYSLVGYAYRSIVKLIQTRFWEEKADRKYTVFFCILFFVCVHNRL